MHRRPHQVPPPSIIKTHISRVLLATCVALATCSNDIASASDAGISVRTPAIVSSESASGTGSASDSASNFADMGDGYEFVQRCRSSPARYRHDGDCN
ncbi:hypothetical protein ON010_g6814 [Phytophthora cinnamomi]|nr:hypothetical protein ON010_g6814 [Phytophthora cinnamomi]